MTHHLRNNTTSAPLSLALVNRTHATVLVNNRQRATVTRTRHKKRPLMYLKHVASVQVKLVYLVRKRVKRHHDRHNLTPR